MGFLEGLGSKESPLVMAMSSVRSSVTYFPLVGGTEGTRELAAETAVWVVVSLDVSEVFNALEAAEFLWESSTLMQ